MILLRKNELTLKETVKILYNKIAPATTYSNQSLSHVIGQFDIVKILGQIIEHFWHYFFI